MIKIDASLLFELFNQFLAEGWESPQAFQLAFRQYEKIQNEGQS